MTTPTPVPQNYEADEVDEDEIEMCGNCESEVDECSCVHCPRCEEFIDEDDECGNCNRCGSCCNCSSCSSCGERYSDRESLCGDCDRCESCGCDCVNEDDDDDDDRCVSCDERESGCQCERFLRADDFIYPARFKNYKTKKPLQFFTAGRTAYKTNKLKRHIAVEVEVAGARCDSPTAIDAALAGLCYSVIEDGSLPSCGFEITTQPTSGDLFAENIAELVAALAASKVITSKACGLHVHVDARDVSRLELLKIIHLYAHLEPALFAMMPECRRKPSDSGTWYCKPFVRVAAAILGAPAAYKGNNIEKILYSVDALADSKEAAVMVSQYKKDGYHRSRYHSLNVHTFFHRGTLECRLHEGVVDAGAITDWALLFANVVEAGKKMSHGDVQKLPLSPCGGDRHIGQWINEASAPAFDTLFSVTPKTLHDYIGRRRSDHADAQ